MSNKNMLSFGGKVGYTNKGDVETVNSYGNPAGFSQGYHSSISMIYIELSAFSTNFRPYYYYY